MRDRHPHGSSPLLATRAGRTAVGIVAAIGVGVLIGIAVLWPSRGTLTVRTPGVPSKTDSAEVQSVHDELCDGVEGTTCRTVGIRLTSGPDDGKSATFTLNAAPPLDPELDPGDKIRVIKQGQGLSYRMADFERRAPMLWLALAFALLVVVFGRVRGALSLAGLGIGLALVLVFIVPAIGEGESGLAVAIVGSLAAMLITIFLAHGFGAKSVAAILGTGASLLLVAFLALLATNLTKLTGLSGEQSVSVSFQLGVSLEGLLLAGMVIGTLGVLDDVTVSQASTVMALRHANPGLGARELYRRAIDVGRDHVSAAVNTLVFAYVGASLPILLVFSARDIAFLDAVNLEVVAQEIVPMLVGSIGLIAAVPLTTAVAAALAARLPPDVAADPHGHAHVH